MKWQFVTGSIGLHCEMFGVNVFRYPWQDTLMRVNVRNPMTLQRYRFPVWRIDTGHDEHLFAAGEIEPRMYGFYLPNDDSSAYRQLGWSETKQAGQYASQEKTFSYSESEQ